MRALAGDPGWAGGCRSRRLAEAPGAGVFGLVCVQTTWTT